MKRPIKRPGPRYFYSPMWKPVTVVRFNRLNQNALWFDETVGRWGPTRFSPWSYGTLKNYYHDLKEIKPTPAIIKGDFSQVDKLYNRGKLPV